MNSIRLEDADVLICRKCLSDADRLTSFSTFIHVDESKDLMSCEPTVLLK